MGYVRTRFTSGETIEPAGAAPWFFDSGADSLEFAYTGGLLRDDLSERLHTPGDLAAWLAARVDRVDTDVTDRDLADARLLRDALAHLYVAAALGADLPADDIDTVNLYAATPDIPPALAGGRIAAGFRDQIRSSQTHSSLQSAIRNQNTSAGSTSCAFRKAIKPEATHITTVRASTNSMRGSVKRIGKAVTPAR